MKRLNTFALSFALLLTLGMVSASMAAAEEPAQKTAAKDTIVVKKGGGEMNPKVDKSKLPDGAWYCDMGGVHYARMDEGDGKCELCGMKLQQKGAAKTSHGHEGHHH